MSCAMLPANYLTEWDLVTQLDKFFLPIELDSSTGMMLPC